MASGASGVLRVWEVVGEGLVLVELVEERWMWTAASTPVGQSGSGGGRMVRSRWVGVDVRGYGGGGGRGGGSVHSLMQFASLVWDATEGGEEAEGRVRVDGYEERPKKAKDRVVGRMYWYRGAVGEKLGLTLKSGYQKRLCLMCPPHHRHLAIPPSSGRCPLHQ